MEERRDSQRVPVGETSVIPKRELEPRLAYPLFLLGIVLGWAVYDLAIEVLVPLLIRTRPLFVILVYPIGYASSFLALACSFGLFRKLQSQFRQRRILGLCVLGGAAIAVLVAMNLIDTYTWDTSSIAWHMVWQLQATAGCGLAGVLTCFGTTAYKSRSGKQT